MSISKFANETRESADRQTPKGLTGRKNKGVLRAYREQKRIDAEVRNEAYQPDEENAA